MQAFKWTQLIISILGSFVAMTSVMSQHHRPLITKDSTDANELINNLFVFVGEKISSRQIPYTPGDFDNGYIASYKILQRVYGDTYEILLHSMHLTIMASPRS